MSEATPAPDGACLAPDAADGEARALEALRARIATALGDVRPTMPGEPPAGPVRPSWRDLR